MQQGVPLKTDRRDYFKARKQACHDLYFASPAELERFRNLAEKDGYPKSRFSAWVVQQLHNATGGQLYPAGYVKGLQDEVEKLREREEIKDTQIKEQHDEIKNLLRQIADLQTVLTPLARGGLEAPPRRAGGRA